MLFKSCTREGREENKEGGSVGVCVRACVCESSYALIYLASEGVGTGVLQPKICVDLLFDVLHDVLQKSCGVALHIDHKWSLTPCGSQMYLINCR